MIFKTVSCGKRQTYNCHSSLQQNIWPYSWSFHILFFSHKTGSWALPLAGALICLTTKHFSCNKIFVWIPPQCECHSNWNILFKIISKMNRGDTLSHSCLKVHARVPIALITFFDPLVLRINCLFIRELLNVLFLNPESSILKPWILI